jgi:hypothetical protein
LHAGQAGRGGLTVRLTGAYRARVIGHAHDAVTPAAYHPRGGPASSPSTKSAAETEPCITS